MNFLEIMQAVSKNAGTEVPTTVGSMTSGDFAKLGEFINEAGTEIARRVDWSALRKVATITGNGASGGRVIADDFDRLARGLNVVHDGNPVRGSLTQDEWFGLEPVEGAPRYFYLSNKTIGFWPYLASADTARIQYQSRNWAMNDKTAMEIDSDEPLVPSDLVMLGGVWRWRRHVGKDFSDNIAEFEAALADRAYFDGGVRQP